MRGVVFLAFFNFALLVSLWSLFDLIVYAALRVFDLRYRAWSRALGSFCVALSLLGLSALFLVTIIYAAYNGFSSSSWEVLLTLCVVCCIYSVIVFATLWPGGLLMRRVMQKEVSLWDSVLFFALYFAVSHLGEIWIYKSYFYSFLSHSLPTGLYLSPFSFSRVSWATDWLPILVVWFFPIVAPLLEIAMRPVWRAYQQHRSGTYQ
jgi:hypothetical protein